MSKIAEIRKLLDDRIKRLAGQPTVLMTVKSVDVDAKTCVLVNDEDFEFPNVRLRPVVDEAEGLTIFPKVGTWCLAVKIEDEEQLMVLSFGEVEKYRLKINLTLFEISAGGVKIEKGEDSLKEVMSDLFGAIQQITVQVVAVGSPSGLPINAAEFTTIKNRMNNILQ